MFLPQCPSLFHLVHTRNIPSECLCSSILISISRHVPQFCSRLYNEHDVCMYAFRVNIIRTRCTEAANIPHKAARRDMQFSRFNVFHCNCVLEIAPGTCHSDEFDRKERKYYLFHARRNRISFCLTFHCSFSLITTLSQLNPKFRKGRRIVFKNVTRIISEVSYVTEPNCISKIRFQKFYWNFALYKFVYARLSNRIYKQFIKVWWIFIFYSSN